MSTAKAKVLGFLLGLILTRVGWTQITSVELLGAFPEDWQKHWIARNTGPSRLPYEVVHEDSNAVLRVNSRESSTTLWRVLAVHAFDHGTISWRWKVDRSLTRNRAERRKIGDDYAARVCVVFTPHAVSWQTRAIHYVWAGREPVGSVYRNPYAHSVVMVVVESGNERAGQWVTERRDFTSDYERFFGEPPEVLTAVAVMVDTDNTLDHTTAWFDDLALHFWSASAPQKPSALGAHRNRLQGEP